MSSLFKHSSDVVEGVFIAFSENNRMEMERLLPALSTLYSNFVKKGKLDIDTFLDDIFTRANVQDEKSIDLDTFKDIVNVADEFFDEIQGYIDLFNIFDTGKKGYIDFNDLKAAREVISRSQNSNDEIKDEELLDMLLVGTNFEILDKSNRKENLIQVFETSDSSKETKYNQRITLKMFCRLLDNIEHNVL